ncbi:adenylate/guanylate cyclase domain-containing protein [Rhizobium sp. MC63]|uniref:Adenylate/guanylate cyclase domain-containing protein n=1 Tax=Rhizobium mulingense TaxID=3031128 RepID=A0ACC6MYW2_9HYPH|nr:MULTISPECIES: adenylate/guanylate cyclase domain-containing protein [unclassified Rhizobium]MDF0698184.1 adenylate/guanylate cyclase domain-containing protein [Rhizobium sp. MC63]MEA3517951.1 adenylate/guanylate cyclase domain-containing protein [Rhizobium sp. MJ31]MEB3043410.1 adenylate/guanylate cyclase domain-containing protein [Rhizobium sp. MJ21]
MSHRLLTVIALLFAGVWGAALGYLNLNGEVGLLDRMEATLADVRSLAVGAREPPPVVSIVAIDDRTAAAHGYPLDRATLARLVGAINAGKPKALALDILLVDPGPEEGDAALTAALRQGPTVIAGAATFAQSRQQVTDSAEDPLAAIPEANQLLLPLPRFAEAAAVGIVNVATDQTGTPRFIPLISRSADRLDPAFPLRAASLALGADPSIERDAVMLGALRIPTDIGQRLPLTFYGGRGSIATFSAADALDGKLPAAAVAGRIVVIGSTVTGGGDVFPTPFDPVMPGVEVMSTAIIHLVTGDGMVRDRRMRLIDAGIAIGLALLLVSLMAWRRSAAGYLITVLVLVVWAMLNLSAFANGFWLSAALPIAAALPPALLLGAAELWRDRGRARHFAEQSALLQRIEAPGLGEWLARDPNFLAAPVRQNAAVIFIDLSGFTGLSEKLGPVKVSEVLSGFFEIIDDEARSHGGAITSFMGDGAMILFGLPEPADDDAARAVSCAVSLCERTRTWLGAHAGFAEKKIGFKVGAHCGPIVASRLGTGDRQQITAAGDTVNVGARLMEVAAHNGVELALSDEIVRAAGPDSALPQAGRMEGPLETELRGRASHIDAWLWRSRTL